MRWVTAKPPNILIVASTMPQRPASDPLVRACMSPSAVAQSAPGADGDDAADGVGHAHQRRVQRRLDVPDHHVAHEAGQHKDGEVPEEGCGALRRSTRTAQRQRQT
jgi:hypothetical protein